MAIETFKSIYKLAPPYLHNLITIKKIFIFFQIHQHGRVPNIKSDRYGRKSFKFGAAQVWNSLPNSIRVVVNYKDCVRLIRT